MGGLRVAVGRICRKAVENRKRLQKRAYVASDIGAGAGTRVGALVRSLVSPRKPPSLIFVSELKPSLRSSSQFDFGFIFHI